MNKNELKLIKFSKYSIIISFIIFSLFVVIFEPSLKILNILQSTKIDDIKYYTDIFSTLSLIPEFMFYLIIIWLIKRVMKKKKTVNTSMVEIIICVIMIYFLWINIFNGTIITTYLRTINMYMLIDIVLSINLVIYIILLIKNIKFLVNKIKAEKTTFENFKYEIIYYPILTVVLIISILTIFNMIIVKIIFAQIVSLISIPEMINISNLINVPFDVAISEILPPSIVSYLNDIGLELQITLSDLGITNETIDLFFDSTILGRIDEFINGEINKFLNSFIFQDLIPSLLMIIGVWFISLIEKGKKYGNYYNIIVLSFLFIISFFIQSTILNIMQIFMVGFIMLFLYKILKDKKNHKDFMNMLEDKKSLLTKAE